MDSFQKAPAVISLAMQTLDSAESVLAAIATAVAHSPAANGNKPEAIQKQLAEREAIVSTGVGSGVAIPHCFLDNIDTFIIGLMTTIKPVAFGSPDGEKVDLFFFIVGPQESRNQHIKILAEISRAARQEDVRKAFRAAEDDQKLKELLVSNLKIADSKNEGTRCLFQVFVQDEDIFEPILEEMSAHTANSISVQELKTAGSYLNRMPLFASLWTEQSEAFLRLITAVVDKPFVNELSRRIHHVAGDSKGVLQGVCITVHELMYYDGTIDF
ncbi:MAG: PTS sugar transporter subunit IIA [Spirochaetaceae bacterium]|nr:MAG: PTS sugar transporter subunit IIA [Spirochaetaceae bacterium]